MAKRKTKGSIAPPETAWAACRRRQRRWARWPDPARRAGLRLWPGRAGRAPVKQRPGHHAIPPRFHFRARSVCLTRFLRRRLLGSGLLRGCSRRLGPPVAFDRRLRPQAASQIREIGMNDAGHRRSHRRLDQIVLRFIVSSVPLSTMVSRKAKRFLAESSEADAATRPGTSRWPTILTLLAVVTTLPGTAPSTLPLRSTARSTMTRHTLDSPPNRFVKHGARAVAGRLR